MYQNVTGYFNTYYNVKKIYGEAVDEIEKSRPAAQDTNYFAPYAISKTADDKLEKVIEKCSKLLQFYPQSAWIDDAILMIGKSYVYKGEGESALRKFDELFKNFPNSSLRFDAKLWKAKAEYYIHQDGAALATINELVSDPESQGEEDIILEAFMLQGRIYVERSEYSQAAESYSKAAEIHGDGYLRAVARFQSGQNLERLGLVAKAGEAYEHVLNDNPDFTLEYRSRLRHAMMLAKVQQFEKALDSFVRLEEEQLTPDQIAMIELEIANTYNDMGDTSKAFAVYTFIDTTYKKSDASARSYYQRGLIFENKYLDFSRARDFYANARSEFPNSAVTIPAQQKANDFEKYFKYQSNIIKYDTLLFHALHPDTSKALGHQSIDENDSIKIHSKLSSVSDTISQKIDSLTTPAGNVAGDSIHTNHQVAAVILDDATTDTAKDESQLPELSEEDLEASLNQRELKVKHKVSSRLHEDDDETADSTESVADQPVDSVKLKADIVRQRALAGQKRQVKVISPDTLRLHLVENEFELAGLFLLELNLPDSAEYWYKRVIKDNPNSSFVPRSLYALAGIYGSRGDSVVVDSLYHLLLTRHEDSEYARQVKKQRGIELGPSKIDSAESVYQNAEGLLTSGSAENAVQHFLSISERFPKSPFAPKAQYTAGWIYENVLKNNDSATSCYRRLLKEYPSSIYASTVQPKIAVKDKPESLQQYVKINQVQLVPKQITAQEENRRGKASVREKLHEDDNQIQKGRGKNRDEDDEEADPDEPETPDPDDDNNN